MKVLSHGDPKKGKPDIKFFCRRCGCVFVAEFGEYKKECSQIEGLWYSAKCPECGTSVGTQDPVIYTGGI